MALTASRRRFGEIPERAAAGYAGSGVHGVAEHWQSADTLHERALAELLAKVGECETVNRPQPEEKIGQWR